MSQFPLQNYQPLHLCDNDAISDEEKGKNRAYKLGKLFELLNKSSSKERIPPRYISIDESMVGYKGIKSKMRQFPLQNHQPLHSW